MMTDYVQKMTKLLMKYQGVYTVTAGVAEHDLNMAIFKSTHLTLGKISKEMAFTEQNPLRSQDPFEEQQG